MGVHGLWRLIEPSGKPVPVESLENKVLAVDVSIWLHQAIKGFQDAKGAPALNAHLLGVFHRVCKLLYFKIKPVFVFDGGVPTLKRETIAKRNKLKHKNVSEADKIQKQLLDTLIKHSAINKVLAEKAKTALTISNTKETEDIFKLPEIEPKPESEDDSSDDDFGSPTKNWNLHNIDTRSQHFKSLPADVRHEILTDLKETRKQSSWGRLHEMPTQSDDFSGFQMKRLLKRQEVQLALEEAQQEMGGHTLSLVELEEILKDQGVISKNTMGNRIASDENTRYLYIRDVKKALEKARKEEEKKIEIKEEIEEKEVVPDKADLELERDIQTAIVLSLQEQPSSSGYADKKMSEYSFLEDFPNLSSEESEEELPKTPVISKFSSAQNYMMEYSGLNPNEIVRIITENDKKKTVKRKIEDKLNEEEKIEESSVKKRKIKEIKEVEEELIPEEKKDQKSIEENKRGEILLKEVGKNNEEKKEDPKIEISSGSEDSDFEEVKDESVLEIKIEKGKFEEEDDLFADIFEKEEKKEVVQNDEIKEKEEPKIVENKDEILKDSKERDEKTEITEIVPEKNERSELLKELMEKAEKNSENGKKLSDDDLRRIREDLNREQIELRNEQGLRERLGTNITDQMYKEAQDLLELFGLPYVIAPMEAEAQCAFLETAALTDGTITDDSDIWLFGGKTVYKNFFNQSKHVLEYRAEDIKHHFKLSREQMILLALLVGSDYTTGLQGVGPVTAMEILAAFPSSNTSTFTLSHNQLLIGLNEFKTWFQNGKSIARGKDSLRNKLKNIKFSESFPSERVVDAYLNPTIDCNEEKFSWSKPDVEGLIEFSRSKFGWNRSKTDDILKPVLKRMKETKYQSSLLNYFKIKHNLNAEEAQKLMSARVKSAVEKFGKDPKELEEIEEKEKLRKIEGGKDGVKKRKSKKGGEDSVKLDENVKTKGNVEIDDNPEDSGEKLKRKSKKVRKNTKKDFPEEEFGDLDKIEELIEKIQKENKREEKKEEEKNENKIEEIDLVRPSTSKIGSNELIISKHTGKALKKTVEKKKSRKKMPENSNEIELLNRIETLSEKRVEEIETETKQQIEAELKKIEIETNKKKMITRNLHRKEVIPQRERDKKNLMKTRMKAIEIYRKTKIDPTSKKKKNKIITPKDDAGLSESSDEDL